MSDTINKKEQLKTIKNGKGIQYILDEAYKILGNPIALFDIYYNLIAHVDGVVTDDPLWNELITTKCFSQETKDFFKAEGFIEAVSNSTDAMPNGDIVALLQSDKLKYDRFNGTIFDKDNIRLANINVTACNKPFEDGDAELTKEICKILLVEIEKSECYSGLDIAYQETLLGVLIRGEPMDRYCEIQIRVSDIYRGLKRNIYVAVVNISHDKRDYSQLVYYRDLFKQAQNEYKYYIYADYILILISTDNLKLRTGNDLYKLIELFAKNNMLVGVSRNFENLFELHKYYTEAVDALHYGMESNDGQRLFFCDDMLDLLLED